MENEKINFDEISSPEAEKTEEISDEIQPQEEKKSKSKKKKKRQKRSLSYYFTGGIFMSMLGALANAIYNLLANGLFGTIFTGYSAEQRALDTGYARSYVFGSGNIHSSARTIRGKLSEGFESSFLVGLMNKISRVLLSTSLKNYGNYLLSFGLYTVFIFFIRQFTDFLGDNSEGGFSSGMVIIIASIPLLMSKNSLARALGSSRGAHALLCDAFGFREESFDIPPKQSRFRANFAIIAGILSGLLTVVISPLDLALVLLSLVAVALVIASPELGVVLSLFSLPFLSFTSNPSLVLAVFLSVTVIGYLIKLIRGKRIIKFEAVDIAVLVFMALIAFSGAISVGGNESLGEALLACALMLIYFLVTNMMRTEKWVNRCVMALVSSAYVVSALGVLEYFFGDVSARWLDTTYFSDIKGRVVSLFDNSNVLGFYLVIIFPFALDLLSRCKTKKERFLVFVADVLMVLCVVFTWSRGAWLGMLISFVLYLLIRTRKTLKAIFGLIFTIPLWPLVLPDNVIHRFLSIGDLSDSSTYYRVYTWKGSIRAALDGLWGGFGYGNSAFAQIYPQYAYAGIEAAAHSHNLILQIVLGMGLTGLAVFFLVLLLFSQKNLEFFKNREENGEIGVTAAAFSGFAAALVMGLFDYIWYNNRVFFLFWAVMGIACASMKVQSAVAKRKRVELTCESTSASIEF